MEKRVLFLCSANPLGIGGGEFATRAYLKAVCEVFKGNVDLLITDDWHDDYRDNFQLKNIYSVSKRTKWQVFAQYLTLKIDRFAKKALQIVNNHIDDYCCVVVNGSILAGSISPALKKTGLPVVAIYHNYEPEYYSDNFHGAKRFFFLPAVKKLERRAYKNSGVNLFLSSQDMCRFNKEYGTTSAIDSVLGVFEFEDKPVLINESNEKKESLFFVITGSLNTVQGEDGIKYFFEDLYRYLPKESSVIVAGKNPTGVVKRLCSQYPNVKLIPNPKDINEVISYGDVYVCPTRLGGGVKLRVMDGLRLGLPVITHTCSARGYDLFWGTSSFEIFETPQGFSDAVNRIVKMSVEEGLDKKSVYSQYIEVFSYSSGMERLRIAVEKILDNKMNN